MPGPKPRHGGRRRLRLAGIAIVILVGGLVVAGRAGLGDRLIPLSWRTPAGRSRPAYVGSESCGSCHPGESASFVGSGHARTLRVAAKTPLARKLDGRVVADPERPDVRWTYSLHGGEFAVARSTAEGSIERFVIEYAFGSDHHATTFVSLGDGRARPPLEHRLTHYAPGDRFGITPGQSVEKPYPGTTPHGRELPDWETRSCFRCHTTRLSSAGGDALVADEMILNVSCERCHGPASVHVANAQSGRGNLTMPFGAGRWTAESQMALCGKCHRHPGEALPGRIRRELASLVRFQPVGIMQSGCFQASDGAFSCVTCHDPHARAASDRGRYEAVCLKCHSTPGQTPCPVSPTSECISCHMPRVDSGQRVLFTDHWIRVRTPADPHAVPVRRPGAAEGQP